MNAHDAEILRNRARRIAAEVVVEPAERKGRFLTFESSGERYAIEDTYLSAVTRAGDVARIPGVADTIAGITHHQGEILAVADLRSVFGLPARAVDGLSRLLVLGHPVDLALIADSVHDVIEIGAMDLSPRPESLKAADAELVKGVTKTGVLVLDGRAVLESNLFRFKRSGGSK